MYIPSSFCETDLEVIHDLMRSHPLGLLVTHGASGLMASPIPFLIYSKDGENGTLRAHMARANPHWKYLSDSVDCLVVFQGAEGYVTPSWYRSKSNTHKVVPTWNYATVHAWGKPLIVEDTGWLKRQLCDLTKSQEELRSLPWDVSDAPSDYIATQMKSIIGIEIPIDRIEGKWKMSQNKDESDRTGVVNGMRSESDAHKNFQVAELVERGLM